LEFLFIFRILFFKGLYFDASNTAINDDKF